ncbi:hypothetical protein [Acinetobacter pittii]|uniref:hypothetical protein n=1 Tax=Acinetobacter pittii TaxID=48296 RepID=UPI0024DE8269|nr:hypothetical protein [Acinetobacter pittii]
MEVSKFSTIENIAKSVLYCLENELKNFISSCHERFPHGCCDIASGLLLRALSDAGICDFNLIRGTDSEDLNHVWIENDKFIIDLTSHQFDNFSKPIILINKEIYPLNKAPYYMITEITNVNDWPYFSILATEFFEIFYSKYYIKN